MSEVPRTASEPLDFSPGTTAAVARNIAGKLIFTTEEWSKNPDFTYFRAAEGLIRHRLIAGESAESIILGGYVNPPLGSGEVR